MGARGPLERNERRRLPDEHGRPGRERDWRSRRPDLGDAVKKVWASALLPDALTYLAARGVRDIAMAVVLQLVVRADAAGVMFTGPPVGVATSVVSSGEMLVNVAFGLAIPVVDGAATPDVVRVDRATGRVVDYIAADKSRALVVGRRGLEEVAVEPGGRGKPSVGPVVLAQPRGATRASSRRSSRKGRSTSSSWSRTGE